MLHGNAAIEFEHLLVSHGAEPLTVEDNLGFIGIEDLECLSGVGLSIGKHLISGQRGACSGASGRVSDGSGKVANKEHRLMSQFLKLTQFFNGNRVPKVNVWCGWVYTKLDA